MNQFTIQAQRALQLAIELAEECHHQYIGTEHILLGLVREGTAVAGKVLKANNVTEDKIMETHLKNLDVQIMLCGEEYVAFNTSDNMKIEKIDKEKDLVIYSGDVLFNILLKNEDVLVLYPNDVHMPGLKVKESKKIKKLVFKVPLNEL